MDISAIFSKEMILVSGAVIIAVAAYFILKSGSKPKGKSPKIVEETKQNEALTSEENSGDQGEEEREEKESPFWKIKRSILSKIRSRKKPDIDQADNSAEDEIHQLLNEDTSETDGLVSSDITSENTIPNEGQQEMSQESVVSNESYATDTEAVSSGDISGQQEEPPATEDTTSETSQVYVEEEVTEPASEKSKSGSGGDIFSMFMDDGAEESEVSKFAAHLDEIKIDDLMQKVEDIKRNMRK